MLGKIILISLIIPMSLISCETERCQIDYKSNLNIYKEAVKSIHRLDLEMNSEKTYFQPVRSINQNSKILSKLIFKEIDYVECHKDSTIIFQAYNCQKETSLRDVVYLLSYSPKGIQHLEGKRNTQNIIEIETNWFYGKHINTIAD
jgi:hypothetical protein